MTYDLCITAVSERADLFCQAMASLLHHLDLWPARLIVHEDVRCTSTGAPLVEPGPIGDWLRWHPAGAGAVHKITSPAAGLGPAMRWCFEQAASPIVLYTQEDMGAARQIPVRRALEVMTRHGLNHIRWNCRQTLPAKHGDKGKNPSPWRKVEVQFDGQTLCISDHFYTHTSLWRVGPALEGMRTVLQSQAVSSSNQFVARFNEWMNQRNSDGRPWNDQQHRHERLSTYIWGGIGEPAYLTNLDPDASRTTGAPR